MAHPLPALFAAGAALLLAMPAAAQDLTVRPARSYDPATLVSVGTITVSWPVETAGLDLVSAAGRQELARRIHTASVRACRWLDAMYPVYLDDENDCIATTEGSTLARFRAQGTLAADR